MARTSYIRRDDVLDQHGWVDFYSVSSMTCRSTRTHKSDS